MIGFPNAKINIGLNITSRLPNGFHQLKSLMVPTNFCDILEFVPSQKDELVLSGLEIPGKNEDNLLWKVLGHFRDLYEIPPLSIHLHKTIPTGAGLGGGSADAAFFINLLDRFFALGMKQEKKEEIAALTGSDCPFFIKNQPAIISGTGTTVTPLDISLKNYYLVIVFPGFSISTARAYAGVSPQPEEIPLEESLKEDISRWKENIKNDFERSLFPGYTGLSEIKQELYSCGAVYASLSGSGSALYGIFRDKPLLSESIRKIRVYEGYF